MNRYTFSQTQLYALFLFAGILPTLALVAGFHLAWQYQNNQSATQPEGVVLQGFPFVVEDTEDAPQMIVDSESRGPKAPIEIVVEPQPAEDDAAAISTEALPDNDVSKAAASVKDVQGFSLQIAAFLDKGRAIAWAAQQQSFHKDVHLLKRNVSGQTYFSVTLGSFTEREEAKAAQRELVSGRGVSSYVIETGVAVKEITLSS